MIELKRTDLVTTLDQMANTGSLLVVGGPGAGKSWLLQHFADRRTRQGDTALLILAEEYNHISSVRQLEESLGIETGLIPTLKSDKTDQKFLVIDSLDSLRAEGSQRVFRQLIQEVHRELPDWKVVASIRSFDANESIELQRLFPTSGVGGKPLRARHLVVPSFSDEDITQAKQQDPRLQRVLDSAAPSLKEILRNAFNLWLVIHLLDENVGMDWLSQIESEIQLFERYWHYRIRSREDANDRLSILADVTKEMVDSRTLSIAFSDAYKHLGLSKAFQHLLSDEILRKTQTGRVAYTHNILFDFSVAKVLLDEDRLLPFLRDAELGIFFRPSVSYFLGLLWINNRDLFWTTTSHFFAPDSALPARLHVLPGMTIARLIRTREDTQPLLTLDRPIRDRAILSLLRAGSAFSVFESPQAPVWLQLLADLSDYLDLLFLNEFLSLLEAADRKSSWEHKERERISDISIKLLKWMWSEASKPERADSDGEQLTGIAAGRVIPIVVRSFESQPEAVKAALRIVLDRIGRQDVSVSEASSIARNLQPIIDVDPMFAVDVYSAIFAYKEESKKETQLGSKVLVLRSNRAQDYQLAYYILGERFSYFLDRNIGCAALAAIRSVNAQVKREHVSTARSIGCYSVSFRYATVKSKLVSDRCEIWDQDYRDDISLKMLDELLNKVSQLLVDGDLLTDGVWGVFLLIASENRFPVVWKRLLEHSKHHPELLPFTLPLLQSAEILAAPETTVAAGDVIQKHFLHFTGVDRSRIEAAIWAVAKSKLAKRYRDPFSQRNRLLACIPDEGLSDASKEALEAARVAGKVSPNEPFFKVGPATWDSFTDEDWLRSQGTNPNSEPNQTLLAAKRTLSDFETKYLNEIPSIEDIQNVLPKLQSTYEVIQLTNNADQPVITDALTTVTAVAETILKNGTLNSADPAVQSARRIIERSTGYPYPNVSEDADENYDQPSWSPTPKIEAAQGLMHIVANWGLDQELRNLIKTASTDRSPSVRFQIASGLAFIYKHDRTFFWELANSMAMNEKALGVIVELARTVGQAYIASRDPKDVVTWMWGVSKRRTPKSKRSDLKEVIVPSLTYLYIYVNEPSVERILGPWFRSPIARHIEMQCLANSAAHYIAYRIESDDPDSGSVRARARELELRLLGAVDQGLQNFENKLGTGRRGSRKSAEKATQLLMVCERLVFQLYLIINANPQIATDQKKLTDPKVEVFFAETSGVWEAVVSANSPYRRPMGPSTAHHLLECFNRLLPFNPGQVLSLAWWLITGRTFGYQFDQMAIAEFVRFAEQILADHKTMLRDRTNAVRFAEILDVFVSAGWPDATRIVLELDDAIR
jgi:hypothetical protein